MANCWRQRARALLLGGSLLAPVALTAAGFDDAVLVDFARSASKVNGVDADELLALLRRAEFQQRVVDSYNRPAESLSWARYRKLLVTDARIAQGRAFLSDYRDVLARAEAEYGVPPEIIGAIIGVESSYGGNRGRLRVIDSLSTLAFRYPRRERFGRQQLTEFLGMARREGLDPLAVKGSYAGAIGIPQFIPTSYTAYAVDFDGDGSRDLVNSFEDAIGSVASYLAEHGWVRDGRVKTRLSGAVPEALLDSGRRVASPDSRVSALTAAGVTLAEPAAADEQVSVFSLEGAAGTEHWAGFRNFYVITTYNHSNLYAMAVSEIASELGPR